MKLLSLVVMIGMAGCSEKDKEVPRAGSAAASKSAGATPPKGAASRSAAGKLDCDKVFPQALRDKHFAGAKFKDVPAPLNTIGDCEISSADEKLVAKLTATCHDGIAGAGKQPTIDSMKKSGDTEVAGVGSPALQGTMEGIGRRVTAWDTDSNCQTMLLLYEGAQGDPIEITKDLLAHLPAK